MEFTTSKLQHLFATTSVELGLFCPYSQLLDHLSSVCMFYSVQLLCQPNIIDIRDVAQQTTAHRSTTESGIELHGKDAAMSKKEQQLRAVWFCIREDEWTKTKNTCNVSCILNQTTALLADQLQQPGFLGTSQPGSNPQLFVDFWSPWQ